MQRAKSPQIVSLFSDTIIFIQHYSPNEKKENLTVTNILVVIILEWVICKLFQHQGNNYEKKHSGLCSAALKKITT